MVHSQNDDLGFAADRRTASSIARATPKNIGPAKRNTSTPLGSDELRRKCLPETSCTRFHLGVQVRL
jgi:hypothetical protein